VSEPVAEPPPDARWQVVLETTFFLAGPTAIGKTAVAVALAEACEGEIVGADAFQLYDGLDHLTAQPSPEERRRVPHHLVGSVPLSAAYHVARYREEALPILEAIVARGRRPIVCGGTGLYLRALTHGLAELPAPDPALRTRLEAAPLPELLAELDRLDPAATVDRANPRRVLRAVEVSLLSGRPFSSFREQWEAQPRRRGVLLERPREVLHRRIETRARALFAPEHLPQVAAEIEAARRAGIGPTAAQVLGWRELNAFLSGDLLQEEAIASLVQGTRRYAKRQITWFRREPWLVPVELPDDGPPPLERLLSLLPPR